MLLRPAEVDDLAVVIRIRTPPAQIFVCIVASYLRHVGDS